MVTLAQLSALDGAKVRFRFRDGFVLIARIVSVQDYLENQVAYKALEVLDTGNAERPHLRPGEFYATSLTDIQEVERV